MSIIFVKPVADRAIFLIRLIVILQPTHRPPFSRAIHTICHPLPQRQFKTISFFTVHIFAFIIKLKH